MSITIKWRKVTAGEYESEYGVITKIGRFWYLLLKQDLMAPAPAFKAKTIKEMKQIAELVKANRKP